MLNIFKRKKPNPNILAEFLVYEIYFDKQFYIDFDSILAEIPSHIKDLVKAWICIYASWSFKETVHNKFGSEMNNKMLSRIESILSPIGKNEIFLVSLGLVDEIRNKAEMNIPFEYTLSISLLHYDPNSPYFMKEEIDQEIISKVAEALVNSKAQFQGCIDYVVETHTK